MRNSRRTKENGFTLIELLVAISILAIVAVLGWRGLDSIVRSRVQLTKELEQTRGMQLTFAQLQSDCEHIASSMLTFGTDRLATDQGSLTLVRTVLNDNQPTRMQVVAYRLKEGVLTRRESISTRDIGELNMFWRATLDDTDGTPPVTLQLGVDAMTVRLWNGNAGPWRTSVGVVKPSVPEDTGLEVAVQVKGNETGIVKIFLLGAL